MIQYDSLLNHDVFVVLESGKGRPVIFVMQAVITSDEREAFVRDARGRLLFVYDMERGVLAIRRNGLTTEVPLERLWMLRQKKVKESDSKGIDSEGETV